MKFEFSAGGVVIKKEQDTIYILLAKHSQHHGWVFPKGLIGDHIKGEGKEETAIREVQEETGATAEIIQALRPVTYWYIWEKEKIKKTVYYFLMKYVSGDITHHDHEMEDVQWVLFDMVEIRLTYKSDKEVWGEAKQLIKINES